MLNDIQYLQTALEATPLQRLQMWKALPEQPRKPDGQMKKALLQSVPGHPAYDPDAARASLTLLADQHPRDYGVLARTRLAEMRVLQNCHTQVLGLQKQLDAVADIERELGGDAR